ncbi:MAG: hypothetical protein M3Y77_08285 [Actinomycetota bacterium]|nr:hypothetical protein [Actinomycetota bacterium]
MGKSTAGSPPDSLAGALAFGLVLAALVGGLGQVSGAHLNSGHPRVGRHRQILGLPRKGARPARMEAWMTSRGSCSRDGHPTAAPNKWPTA